MPLFASLEHTYPRSRTTQEDRKRLGFYIIPSSEDFLGDLDYNAIERSPNNIPHPKLEVFAQNLISTQRGDRLTALVNGIDLSLEWGQQHLRLGTLSEEEVKYTKAKMGTYAESMVRLGQFGTTATSGLTIDGFDKGQRWATIVSRKQEIVGSYYNAVDWNTQFRRKDSGDPRLQQDRPV